MVKIAFFEVNPREETYIRKKLKNHDLYFFSDEIQSEDLTEIHDVEIISVFIYSSVDKEVLKKLPKLRAIMTRSTGFDHISVLACKSLGIQVSNVPFYGENTVAEHTFALILNLSRKVHKSYQRTIGDNYSIEGLQGFDLKGKTLGIIGVGHIGLHVIRIAKGFGMHVKAYDLNKDIFMSEVLHFNYCYSINELLRESDIITLHMPFNKQTYHFLDKEHLEMTKKGVIIINTARGGLLDTDALYNLLEKGHIGGVGLDVIEGEDIIKEEEELLSDRIPHERIHEIFRDKRLFKMENVIFTPHNAFNSKEAVQRILDTSIDNILSMINNGKVINPVN